MRLLHTSKLIVKEFTETQIQTLKYAILSHTWEEEEVTFQDMQGKLPEHKKGFSKIQSSCTQAKKDGFDYIWIDCCCIDKSSSAELSEAINSMYRWYKKAEVCYAYLFDVPPMKVENPGVEGSTFRRSKWFTRGWTLQELIAPRQLIFVSQNWEKLFSKEELSDVISGATGIDGEVLKTGYLKNISIARKMSWAANRVTTRLEDRAYSLLGIFDVNMPLLYGEGQKSFIRLQEEILKQTDDDSLFAHQLPAQRTWKASTSILAESPDCFSKSAELFLYQRDRRLHDPRSHVSVPSLSTNKGVQIHSFGCPCTFFSNKSAPTKSGWLMILNCRVQGDIFARPAILLKALDLETDRFERYEPASLQMVYRKDGNIKVEYGWNKRPKWRGKRGGGPYLEDRNIIPDFKKLQHRTIFVGLERSRAQSLIRPYVWVPQITNMTDRNYELQGWPRWNPQSRMVSGEDDSIFGADDKFFHGALMLQDIESDDRFAITFALKSLPDSYQTYCAVVKLFPNHDCPTVPSIYRDIDRALFTRTGRFPEIGSEASYVLNGGLVVQASLNLEEFLERKEFILTIEIDTLTDKMAWKKLRYNRVELISYPISDGVPPVKLGHMLEGVGLIMDQMKQEGVNLRESKGKQTATFDTDE